ncbi:hypothetical protein N7466_011509 [Penicillium verhagenii]|uniref:uncharacterized protein n=1 Tax=Penicillium verhagenii TaxID=1562060 RepID=UPI002545369F|nr:uncharacterized protein N7466_011509 [Penicillium verhagenii]KAJ5915576.1 hypothetical protein N7466_011509 [Penicillium verhagenii]
MTQPITTLKSLAGWESAGLIKVSRVPQGKPPVAKFHGVLWLYMIGNHVLCGSELAQRMPWALGTTRENDHSIKIGRMTILADRSEEDYEVVAIFIHHARRTTR